MCLNTNARDLVFDALFAYDVEEMNEFHAKFIANHPEYRGLYDPHRYDDEEDPCGPTDENNPLIHRGSF